VKQYDALCRNSGLSALLAWSADAARPRFTTSPSAGESSNEGTLRQRRHRTPGQGALNRWSMQPQRGT